MKTKNWLGQSSSTPYCLIIVEKRREELTLKEFYESYDSQSGLEHFFRFGKQKLLINSYQTPDTPREENLWKVMQMDYLTLWVILIVVKHPLHTGLTHEI